MSAYLRGFLSHPVTWMIGAFVVIMVVIGLTISFQDKRLSANELCAGHDGVASVGGGGWATPLIATCRDGYSGEIEP